ncbi:hypothetical protein [Streptomyces sporangiiformans]|uniref:Uncharacterized protein n=1 Tax=Streptomyces sporangiiformans TaxID=2315329 RepID=A0A505DFG9_9ACTN|nr:hypothetical protein [Streptomyces sporangiiformans]TPQ19318.1 hypothetical protein FGD71_026545 [Streptomyces sporangiiformans]
MESMAGAVIASSVMLSATTLVATGLLWASAGTRERRTAAERSTVHQQELRTELTELSRRVGALQRLLEGVD